MSAYADKGPNRASAFDATVPSLLTAAFTGSGPVVSPSKSLICEEKMRTAMPLVKPAMTG